MSFLGFHTTFHSFIHLLCKYKVLQVLLCFTDILWLLGGEDKGPKVHIFITEPENLLQLIYAWNRNVLIYIYYFEHNYFSSFLT